MHIPTDARFSTGTPDHWQNLLWALSASDIAPDFPLPWLSAERRSALLRYFSAPKTCHQLTQQLNIFLEQSNSRRLGIYFENLWAFAFQNHPDYTLLARNLPIRSAGRTLGELDFLVRYLPDKTVEHWELAVKFYLQVREAWVGPGLRDRLDIKLARMREHQLPIIQNAETQSQLAQRHLTPQRQWALMPGRLFTPLEMDSKSEPGNWWADAAQFLQHFSESENHWFHLPKQAWLASCGPADPLGVQPLPLGAINREKLHNQLNDRGPLCIASVGSHGEVNRGFIVPDDWQQRASQSHRPN